LKRFILPLTALASFVFMSSAFADQQTDALLSAEVKQLNARAKELQAEVDALKSAQTKEVKKVKKMHAATQAEIAKEQREITNQQPPRIVRLWEQYVTVTTVPFTNKSLAYNGSDLLYNYSSMNEDLTLLKLKKDIQNELEAAGYKLRRPILQLSGSLAGQIYSSNAFTPNSANGAPTSGVALSNGELDFNAMASSWATGFMALDYNGSPISTGNRNPISSIYLERGFLTLGNLNVFPVYFTIGQMYSPFGQYTNSMVSTPVTTSMMQIRTPTAILGFTKGNFMASAFTYEGSETSGGTPMFKQGGANAGYKFAFSDTKSLNFGVGYVTNVADSQGMQGTGYASTDNQFGGFGSSVGTDNLVHSVGGGDVNATAILGPVTMLAEYISSLEAFSPVDLSFDNGAAKPVAQHYEIDYLLPFIPNKYATTLGVSYDHTEEALALNLEKNQYAIFLNTSLFRETVESIEYNFQQDYSSNDTANGNSANGTTPTPILGTGKGINSVLMQAAVYF